ncbi:hypothetical protein AB4622_10165 [Vibrio splendidus]
MDNLDLISFDFFKLFSRAEYALKAASFNNGDGGNVQADWTKFAQEIHQSFMQEPSNELVKAVKYIQESPPKKQIIEDGNIKWSDTPPHALCDTDLLLLYVRRVRNNLFHGGKFNVEFFAPERSEELISVSITILKHAVELNEQVKQAYDS